MTTILWVDDEIDHLTSHIRFLEKRGFRVLTASSGSAALELLSEQRVDLVLMDQMMIGMDGMETLERVREHYHALPVVMVTQSEEEELMDRALGGAADDYLTKPVNPSQILLVIKRLLMGQKLRTQHVAREMVDQTARMMEIRTGESDWRSWVEMYASWVEKDVASGGYLEEEMGTIQKSRFDDLAMDFSRLVERSYPDWIAGGEGSPLMSHNYLERVVVPRLGEVRELVMLVMDCMRYDQWLTISPELEKWFHVDADFMLTALPSATPYSRNAIFAGLTPRDIWRFYRRLWVEKYGEPGLNRHEPHYLAEGLARLGHRGQPSPEFVKVGTRREGEALLHSLSKHLGNGFLAVVVNYIDHLTHGRSELDLIRDLAPDVRSFRRLAETWFRSSFLRKLFQTLAARGSTVLVTSDHGSVFTTSETRIRGGRNVSGSIRYRFGHSMSADPKSVIHVEDPGSWGLPDEHPTKSYLLARSDYFMVFQGMPREDLRKFRNTFQHGGVSMEEMIVPSVVLTPKRL